MEWLTSIRLALVVALFYAFLPAWGSQPGASWFAVAFVRFSLFVSFTVGLLGLVGLALPGAVLTLCLLWIGSGWTSHLQNWRESFANILERITSVRWPKYRVSLDWAAIVLVFIATARSPVANMSLSPDQVERASSLAILGHGHPWAFDASALLLLPAQWLSAIPAPRVVALIEPIVACVFLLAVEFAVCGATNSRSAAALSLRAAAGVQLWTALHNPEYGFAAHLGGIFFLLMVGLWTSRRNEALMSGLLALVLFTTLPSPEPAEILIPSFACVALGIGIARASEKSLRLASRASLAALAAAVVVPFSVPAAQMKSDAGARLALAIGADRPQNSWMLVSTAQEAPFVYGRGWHMDVAQFAGEIDALPVHDAQFHFAYPVRELYVFLEPNPSGSAEHIAAEFRAAHQLAAYAAAHPGVATLYQGPDLLAYRVPIEPSQD